MRERETLVHAEAMLLVHDRERQIAEFDFFLEQRMRADQQVEIAGFEPCQDIGAFLAALAAGEDRDAQARRFGDRRDRLQQPDRLVALEQIEQVAQRLAARRGQIRIAREDKLRVLAGGIEQGPVHFDTRDAEARHAGLAGAEHVAFTTQAQVLLCDAEAILGLAQDFDAGLGGLAERRAVEQKTGRALTPAADSSTQLMDLRQAEALGMLDHHHGRLGNIDADLDHGGGDEKLALSRCEARHRGVLVGALHLAMHEVHGVVEMLLQLGEALFGGGEIADLGLGDQRAHPVDPLAALERATDRLDHLVDARERQRAGIDRLAAGGLLAQLRDVHVAEISEHQRARDRRCGQHQHIDGLALAREREALVHAEAMLLVHDRERQIAEFDFVLEQRMRADQQVDITGFKARQDVGALLAALTAGEDRDPQARPLRPAARSSCDAVARGFRSAPSRRPAARPR